MAADYTATAIIGVDAYAGLDPGLWGRGNLECYAGTITLASQTKNKSIAYLTTPALFTPLFGFILSDTSLGSSTVSVGIEGTLAKYKPSGTMTTVDAPVFFMEVLTCGVTVAAAEEIWLTETNTANLPAAGQTLLGMIGSRHNISV